MLPLSFLIKSNTGNFVFHFALIEESLHIMEDCVPEAIKFERPVNPQKARRAREIINRKDAKG